MRHTKTTVTITKKLLSDLLNMAIFRIEELEEIAESKKRIAQTKRVIARATKVSERTGGIWTI